MDNRLKNKIEATDKSISSLLKDQKFFIDYFQREYRWQEKHIQLLVEDLSNYKKGSVKLQTGRGSISNSH